MKLLNTVTDYFMSPITGRLAGYSLLPSLVNDLVWEGNLSDQPVPSPVLVDMRLTTAQIQNQVDEIASSTFIIQNPNKQYIPNSQALSILSTGLLKSTTSTGVLSIAVPFVDYVPAILTNGSLWTGNSENVPSEIIILPITNMANLANGKLWTGNSSNRPVEIIILPIANMANLANGALWTGNGSNRPVEITILPITNMANLTDGKVWVGDGSNRPIESSYTPFDNTLTYVTNTNEISSLPNSQPMEPLGTGLTKLETGGMFAIAVPDEDYTSWTKFEELANCTFIVQTANDIIPAAQALDVLPDGVMVNEGGAVTTSDLYVQSEGIAIAGNIAIFVDSTTIEDSDTSIPDLEALVEEAQTAADEAAASAEEAAASAGEASASAAEASAAAAEASAAAASAAASAFEADLSEAGAALSALAAAGSASSASSSASDASSSASAAASSASAAAGSASAAAGSASAAASSETAAAGSATAAASSATSAAASLATFLSTDLVLSGDVTGSGLVGSPIVTVLALTLDEIPLAATNVSLNSHKITNLANGTSANDAVNYSQLTGIPGSLVVNQNTSSVTMVSGRSYYINNGASLVTLTLPTTAAQGDTFIIVGGSSGGWKIAQNSGQIINLNSTPTTSGSGGSLQNTNRFNCITIACITANTTFVVRDPCGIITVV